MSLAVLMVIMPFSPRHLSTVSECVIKTRANAVQLSAPEPAQSDVDGNDEPSRLLTEADDDSEYNSKDIRVNAGTLEELGVDNDVMDASSRAAIKLNPIAEATQAETSDNETSAFFPTPHTAKHRRTANRSPSPPPESSRRGRKARKVVAESEE
ncbi:hypothetical protein PT974_09879 [Cladobotryum mycophilum]|uniref:Uncharacterized protein n=1 Tax=Cladobotryum mycophilum TaxID=491253 RepID=A0ABR0SHV5_9HYPO